MPQFCAVSSAQVSEPLAGTAATARVWIALEQPGAWAPRAPKTHTLPADVAAVLRGWGALPGARLQFIRRGRPSSASRVLLVADAAAGHLFRATLSDVAALVDLDVPALLRDGHAPGFELLQDPVALVCTHGQRDRCCAKWGGEVFRAMLDHAPEQVWQTTHLGGHRFAPTLVILPHGHCYGRVPAASSHDLLAAHADGRVADLDLLRGRSALPAPAQVAEVALRRRFDDLALDAVTLRDCRAVDEGRWIVSMAIDGAAHEVEVTREVLDDRRLASCGDEAPKQVSVLVAR